MGDKPNDSDQDQDSSDNEDSPPSDNSDSPQSDNSDDSPPSDNSDDSPPSDNSDDSSPSDNDGPPSDNDDGPPSDNDDGPPSDNGDSDSSAFEFNGANHSGTDIESESEASSEDDNGPLVFGNNEELGEHINNQLRQWALDGGVMSMRKLDKLLRLLHRSFPNVPQSYKSLLKWLT
ncbi:germ cell nuclear acidic protein-like [Frankliniella occidentalis]|uniref:Germ cell nuclear acidic protein-like n=1 Tax=Frankliniella occidentalis TaxID=133901 RepID=A0A6J1T0A7_FRAOC|nr:germ cell nuclear acidic protein-like [Frankliniella occidentalis]